MAKLSNNFVKGRMNKSLDERLIPQGEYIDALNVRTVSTEEGSAGAVENTKGNELLVELEFNGSPLSSEARCIGAFENGENETIYWFINDPNNPNSTETGKVDLIVSYNESNFTTFYHVISTSVLNFNNKFLINGINILDNLLFFTDNLNPPRKININRTYLNPVNGIDKIIEQDIGVIVKPPLNSPVIQQFQLGGGENYMEDLFLSFAYRWQYEDGEYSALSPFSQVAFTPGVFKINYNNYSNSAMENIFNSVNIAFETGGRNVKDIDLIFKFSTSTSVNVIEKFNKVNEGWVDDITENITFTNKKIFTTLPEAQFLRLFDNVPKKAQAQTIMGNRLMYGNYVEGYDVVNETGKPIYLDYDLELITKDLKSDEFQSTGSDVSYSIETQRTVPNSKITIDFSGVELVSGSQIGINFLFESVSFGGDSSYDDGTQPSNEFDYGFLFNLQRNYISVFDLASSPEFIAAVSEFVAPSNSSCFSNVVGGDAGSSVTDVFNCQIVAKNEWEYIAFGISQLNQGISIDTANGSNLIGITIPALKFEKYDVSTTPNTPLGIFAYEYLTNIETIGLYSQEASKQSLHSNRDYEIAMVYMDDYGRSSTALVDTNNTVFVPCQNSITKNNIRVTLKSYPPFWATKYKFVIKQSKEQYRTIYSNIFFTEQETGDVWFKLEGDNRDKVQNNAILIPKADTTGPVLRCVKTTVLEYGSKIEDFLCKKNAAGELIDDACSQPTGVYMKLSPSQFSASTTEDALIIKDGFAKDPIFLAEVPVYLNNPNTTGPADAFIPFDIPAGSIVTFKFRTNRRRRGSRCGSRTYDYDKTFTASKDYSNLYTFVQGDDIDFTNGISGGDDDGINTINQPSELYDYPRKLASSGQTFITFQEDSSNGRLWLVLQTGTPSCNGLNFRGSYASLEINVNRATTLMVFETEALDANDEIYFENEQSFDIVNGLHLSGGTEFDQNQTTALDAIVDLNFFNCYVFGNGVESNAILDSLIEATLKIGSKATAVAEENYSEVHRKTDITYSGNFNLESNLNKLNEFNLSLANFKTLELLYGPIRKLHSRQTNILSLQEDKISYVLVGKNLLSDSSAGGAIASIPEVLGTQIARTEEYGISNNPESFAAYGSDVFFTDAKRSSVINLKGGSGIADQLNIISHFGMRPWFRDLFIDGFKTQKLGGYDPYMEEYVLSSNTELIPVPVVERNCGYTLFQENAVSPTSFSLDCSTLIGDVNIAYNVSVGSANIRVNYNGDEVLIQTVTGVGNVVFNKPLSSPITAKVTVTPIVKSTYSMQFGCPDAPTLTVKQIVISFEGDINLTTTTRYRWELSTDLSPYNTNSVVLKNNSVSLFKTQTGSSSFGTLPTDGSTITMESIQEFGQSYVFNPSSDKFKYLVSNTNYEKEDINTLLPLLSTSTPILGGPTNYRSSFVYNNNADDDFLYMVWDLREPTLIALCYDETNPINACCDC
jgi:hypothetical protein